MYKQLSLGAITILICFSSFAQSELGIKFGTNLSRMEGQFDYYRTQNQFGFQIGTSYGYDLNENTSIRSELLFTQKGGKIDYTLEGSGAEWKLKGIQRINFLELPINIDIKSPISANKNLILSLGIYGAIGLGGKLDLENDFTDFDRPSTSKIINYNMPMQFGDVVTFQDKRNLGSFEEEYGFIKKYDAGIKFGIGYRVSKAYIGLSYAFGLLDMNPHEAGVISDEIDKTTRSLQLNIIVFFTRFNDKKNIVE
ncbi:MAG: outer membrane beta-barrel protein [Cyclobacteriaceae bacterium]